MRTTVVVIALILVAAMLIFFMVSGPGDSGGAGGDVVSTASGLKYIDLKIGEGRAAKEGDSVTVHYTGKFKDGKKFDSSLDRGKPFTFDLGAGMVIKGWDEGVAGMKPGGKRKLIIPFELAYGAQGKPPTIPPAAELTFEVDLLGVK